MIDYKNLIEYLTAHEHAQWAGVLNAQIAAGLSTSRFGDLPKWLDALAGLPPVKAKFSNFEHAVEIGARDELTNEQFAQLEHQLRALIPWRKGPYCIFGLPINTEWRSDWKWDRLLPHICHLKGKRVLDVGCGNGYHMWRMLGQSPERVIGIDPSPRFVVQFFMLKQFMENPPIDLLPIGIEALPENLVFFDTTFSMGVLYHRRSPIDHLKELKDTLVPGGELILETLVVDGELGFSLLPEGRYAKMNNVWFLPSVPTLCSWLKKVGFANIRCVDTNQTSVEEQRSTDWMTFQSLSDFLDPNNNNNTIEGHPAPKRAIFVATKPE